jgi:endonuclease/exonuclease/phosphatase family metal-dependent hydrolase
MRLISWNVARRVGVRAEAQLAQVQARKPDVVALQEVTRNNVEIWKNGLAAVGLTHLAFSFDVLDGLAIPTTITSGVLVASRWPFELVGPDGRLPYRESVLAAVVQTATGNVTVHAAHIPNGSSHGDAKISTFNCLYRNLSQLRATPTILCGDFNSPKHELPDGTTICWGKVGTDWHAGEWSVLRGLEPHGLRDVFRNLHGFDVEAWSWSQTKKGNVTRRRFDHVLSDLDASRCAYLTECQGLSDHLPVEADFRMPAAS